MKARSTKQIQAYIRKHTGADADLVKADGYFYFWFDAEAESHSVYVYRLSDLTLEDWLEEYNWGVELLRDRHQ
jgi:hypothetical protein